MHFGLDDFANGITSLPCWQSAAGMKWVVLFMQDRASAEAAASKAAAKLLAEEEQAAVKVAAKKAKKSRQKQAKKQQPQPAAVEPSAEESAQSASVSEDVPSQSEDNVAEAEDAQTELQQLKLLSIKQTHPEPLLQEAGTSMTGAPVEPCVSERATLISATPPATPPCSLVQHQEAILPPSGSDAAEGCQVSSSAQTADAKFLKNLFCCPITQVVLL